MEGRRLGETNEVKRTRSASECPTCHQPRKVDESGRFTCACGTLWVQCLGIKGAPEEESLLERSGFQVERDVQGDVYYVMPEGGHIIHLYADGTWHSDKAPRQQSLEDYLAWIRDTRAAIQTLTRSA